MQQLTITTPDDWHLHLRDGPALQTTVGFTARQFRRAIVMPNLNPPITTVDSAQQYYNRIRSATPTDSNFQPLMTLYLTDSTQVSDVIDASQCDVVYAAKLYPAGATTNSENGVTDISKLSAVLDAMQEHNLPLLVHAEVTDSDIDIFDREQVFIDRHLTSIRKDFPNLKLVLEHATTQQAIDFVLANDNTAATLTPQHLLLNRNDLLAGGIRPHNYCLPILKRESHRQALLEAATSGNPKFFLGTDSAPHAINAKESSCGCAGCFSAHAAIELYAEAFDNAGALDKLEAFSSFYGADFYELPRNAAKITLIKDSWQAPNTYPFADQTIVPFRQATPLQWRIQ
ncbi:MAG: dihydroorotase [Piscirickettsiaceae bacterium]|nr:MAG: dihydroorotase [Piscirickettsiaceae bacterium]